MPVKEAEATNSLADQGIDVFTMHVDGPKVIVETAAKRGKMVCGYHASQAKLAPQRLPDWRRVELADRLHPHPGRRPHRQAAPQLRARRAEGRLREDARPTARWCPRARARTPTDIKAKMIAGSFDIFKPAS
jgi:simple sugar transport system substrate-binding protein